MLERLWTRLVPNPHKAEIDESKKDQQPEDVDKMDVPVPEKTEALDPQSVITAFLYGKPVGEGSLFFMNYHTHKNFFMRFHDPSLAIVSRKGRSTINGHK